MKDHWIKTIIKKEKANKIKAKTINNLNKLINLSSINNINNALAESNKWMTLRLRSLTKCSEELSGILNNEGKCMEDLAITIRTIKVTTLKTSLSRSRENSSVDSQGVLDKELDQWGMEVIHLAQWEVIHSREINFKKNKGLKDSETHHSPTRTHVNNKSLRAIIIRDKVEIKWTRRFMTFEIYISKIGAFR